MPEVEEGRNRGELPSQKRVTLVILKWYVVNCQRYFDDDSSHYVVEDK